MANHSLPKNKKHSLRYILIFALITALAIPAGAVLQERSLSRTLHVLHYELQNVYQTTSQREKNMEMSRAIQRRQMKELVDGCNELSLMLYSQNQDFIFDITYALNRVSEQYKSFNANRRPFVDIVDQLDIEIARYQKLINTLQLLPPSLIKNIPDSVAVMDSASIAQYASDASLTAKMMRELSQETSKLQQEKGKPEEEKEPERGLLGALKQATSMVTGPVEAEDSLAGAEGDSITAPGKPQFNMELTGEALVDRDSCIFYAQHLLSMYEKNRAEIIADSLHYNNTSKRLEDAYEYAQNAFQDVFSKIFVEGQANYYSVLSSFKMYWKRMQRDVADKYLSSGVGTRGSEWRGSMIAGFMLFALFYILLATLLSNLLVHVMMKRVKFFQSEEFKSHKLCFILLAGAVIFAITVTIANISTNHHFFSMATSLIVEFAWLLAAIVLSLAIRLKGDQVKSGLLAYTPVIVFSFIIICVRIAFVPNTVLNIFLFPVLLLFTIWQARITKKEKSVLPQSDQLYSNISLIVLCVATVVCAIGYVLLSILLVIWWIFLLTVMQTITAVVDLLKIYYNKRITRRMEAYREKHSSLIDDKVKGSFIEITWLYDFIMMAIIPALEVWVVLLCAYMASTVFDLSELCSKYFSFPFLNAEGYINLSVMKLAYVISMFFIFRYFCYLCKAVFRIAKVNTALAKSGLTELPANYLNLTLSNSIISICFYGAYVITCFAMLHIPSTAISIVSAGLATGIGLALKDVINNFFYGVSLMSGRLRVGDWVECDGIRGKVDSITYQTTQIETDTGSVLAFPNATLYAKNFKNLTRNHAYELITFTVGVKYGVDIEKVRAMLQKALKVLQVKDQYKRDVVRKDYGVVVRFTEFGESSVDLTLYQYVLVEERGKYLAAAREIVYNTLNKNNVEIPYPQRDLHIIGEEITTAEEPPIKDTKKRTKRTR